MRLRKQLCIWRWLFMDRESDNARYDLVIRQSIITKEVGGGVFIWHDDDDDDEGGSRVDLFGNCREGIMGKGDIIILLCDELKKQIVQE
mmetsp:Transcript_20015/g.48070  ORF Transcript_20015/g.48070 Transcript_20015/m.48070 type:complete len:89 (+) Transcript_20015:394-660(+)